MKARELEPKDEVLDESGRVAYIVKHNPAHGVRFDVAEGEIVIEVIYLDGGDGFRVFDAETELPMAVRRA